MLILKLMFLAARSLVSLDIERVSTCFCYVINIDYESVVVSILLKTNFQLNVFTHESYGFLIKLISCFLTGRFDVNSMKIEHLCFPN